jgi:DNA-binding YbaB/EbfC family protein
MNKNMLRQAQQLQAKLAKAQEEIENAVVEASSGGGAVKVVVTGKLKIQSIEISPDAVDPEDVEMLQDLVMAATNEAIEKAQELAQSRLSAITGGMKIPGLM